MSYLKKNAKNKGNDVIKWIIRNSGFNFFIKLCKGKKPKIKIIIKEILLCKNPCLGSKLKNFLL